MPVQTLTANTLQYEFQVSVLVANAASRMCAVVKEWKLRDHAAQKSAKDREQKYINERYTTEFSSAKFS